eukprot:GFUD01018957.1.p1 GENE.GFUD01018957.1~~GFUD01018957.1.p1  ORF type:complete len:371 (+),score=92.16 GFUD01018957.1:162-1274(+)
MVMRMKPLRNPKTMSHNKVSEEMKINCSCVSSCGNFLAICDDYKQISVWTLPTLTLVYQQNLVRKASKVIFTPDSKNILVADKNGDVYKFETETASPAELLLGHLSMLLDIKMDSKGKFLLTADRDEKIRVSKFPNSYNINNYCLGHTEFVTSICFLGEDLLLSGSGDGTVKVWKYLEGREVCSHEVFKDVEVEVRDDLEKMNVKDDLENMEMETNGVERVGPPAQPAVVSVRILKDKLFLVQIEGYKGVCVYEYRDNKLTLKQELKLSSYLLDYDISDQQLLLLNKTEDSVSLDIYQINDSGIVKESSVSLEDYGDFFSPVDNYEDEGVKNLHKRWFDNVKDYMERKEVRVNKTKVSQPPVVKKQKCET